LREGAVTLEVFKALQGQFVHDLDNGLWKLAGPTEALLREVQSAFARLTRSTFVRSLDALHLVTARAEGFDRIYSNDRHLLAAARNFGLEGVDPTSG
jgi:predicted nucleic acid-binding protein